MSIPFPVPPASRPVAMGVNGMVASAHPLASMAGVRMLMDGGNAFDAAVAFVEERVVVAEPVGDGNAAGRIGPGAIHQHGKELFVGDRRRRRGNQAGHADHGAKQSKCQVT